jgi:periplasmic protein TonB
MFDRYVAATKPSWKRRALMIASFALHGIAAIVIIIWSFFHVDEIAPPAVSLTFFSAPPPPPPPPPPARKKSSSETPKTTPQIKPVTQPTDIPKIVQPKEPDKKEEDEKEEEGGMEGGEKGGVKGGEVGGVKGGVVGGVKGGVVGGTGTDPNAKGPPGRTVAGFTLLASQISHPDPHLPEWFKEQKKGSTVKGMYKVCIRNDGHISDVIPMTPIPGVDQQISDQIRSSWLYKPQPVPVCFVAALTFKIN